MSVNGWQGGSRGAGSTPSSGATWEHSNTDTDMSSTLILPPITTDDNPPQNKDRIVVEHCSGLDPPGPSLGAEQFLRGLLQAFAILATTLGVLLFGQPA